MVKYVAQWDSTFENDRMSGLHRYSTELYNRTSQILPIKRYFYKGLNYKSVKNYIPGDVTHITTQSYSFLKPLKKVENCIVTVNDLIPDIWYNQFEKIRHKWFLTELTLDKADQYIAISNYTKNELMYHYNIPKDKIRMIYDGVDHNMFYPRDKAESRKKFGFQRNKYYLLAVSSGLKWKNMELLNKLANVLPRDCEIINIGYGNGKLGYISDDDMPELYSACDIFLAPSKAEGFCLPAVEAMACGTPIIASNATALIEVVADGGLRVEPDDVDGWRVAVDTILSSYYKWSDKALTRSKFFDWDKCANETVKLYKEMME